MTDKETQKGVAAGIAAFLSWGLLPVYWKAMQDIPSLELLSHRILWSFVFVGLVVFISGRTRKVFSPLANRKNRTILLGTSVLICINWLVFIWAVNNGYILEASLGYYINPLLNVVLGMSFLGEHLNRRRLLAVVLALTGVTLLTVKVGSFPWISFVLAGSFGFYGLLRKKVQVGPLTGLGMEAGLLSVPAIVYLIYLEVQGVAALGHSGLTINALILSTGIITALPLIWFAYSVRRLSLTTVGFIQYIGPTGMFLLGVFVYGEKFTSTHLVTFLLIWAALAVYTWDGLKTRSTYR